MTCDCLYAHLAHTPSEEEGLHWPDKLMLISQCVVLRVRGAEKVLQALLDNPLINKLGGKTTTAICKLILP